MALERELTVDGLRHKHNIIQSSAVYWLEQEVRPVFRSEMDLSLNNSYQPQFDWSKLVLIN